ncbi:MAG: hypothetical protein U0939_19245 [Pirellulales bacterium]
MSDSRSTANDAARNEPLHEAIGALHAVARRERWHIAGWFATRALGESLLLVLLDVVADYFLDLPWTARRGAAALVAVIWLAMLAWTGRRAAARVRSIAQLAVAAEQQFPTLRGVLRSALAWRNGDAAGDGGVSRDLIEATRREAARRAQEVDFHPLLDPLAQSRELRRLGTTLAAAAALATWLAGTETGRTWCERNVLGRELDWPRSTQLAVEGLYDGRLRAARGGTATLGITVSRHDGRTAPTPEVRLRPPRSHSLLGVDAQGGRFRFEARDVHEPFSIQFRAGDGRTGWIPVELVDSPRLTDVKLVATTPEYLGGERSELSSAEGLYRLPRGSRLELSALSTKRLASAAAITSAGEWPLELAFESPPLVATDAAHSASEAPAKMRLRQSFTSAQLGDGLLTVRVLDEDGLTLPRPLTVRVEWRDDERPLVVARWRGAGRWIVPTTQIEWSVEAQDDHAVTQVAVLAKVQNERGAEVRTWTRLPLNPAWPESDGGRPVVQYAARLDLSPLELEPGQTVTLATEALDNDGATGPKTGRSAERILRVVTPDELRGDWQRRDKEQRQLLEQAYRDWRDVLDELDGPASTLTAESPEAARRLSAIRQTAASCLGPLGDVTDEMAASGLESPASPLVERRKTRIMEPLRSATRDPAALDAAPNRIDAARERRLLAQLQSVLRELSRAEGFQEAVRLLEELATGQETVLRETLDLQRQRVREVLERKERGAATGDDGAK